LSAVADDEIMSRHDDDDMGTEVWATGYSAELQ